ncbi:MAG: KdsC family phosphatase [Brachymonas sp.]
MNLPVPAPSLAPRVALALPDSLLTRAKAVRVVFFDVDGVLTDGRLYYSEQGEVLKAFHSLDGHGLKMLQRAGIVPAIISGRDSPALRTRLMHLGITQFALGTEDKLPAAEKLLAAMGLDWSQAAAMGDDWPDLPLLHHAAFACAPANAHHEAKAAAHFVTQILGGMGAARELVDVLLQACGQYQVQLDKHRAGNLHTTPQQDR